jgi:hypothetical protein
LKNFSLSIVSEEPTPDLTVLKIASASRNSSSQLYPDRILLTTPNLEDLQKKITKKLNLHGIKDLESQVSLHFANDRVENFDSFDSFLRYDFKVDPLTESLGIKWSFIFDSTGVGNPHLHCVSLRFADFPAPGALLQRMLSARAGDQDESDPDFLTPTVCKLDFADNRFATELFSVVSDWIKAQPRVEPAFGFMLKLKSYEDSIRKFIENTLPTIALLAYLGIWLGLLPDSISNSVKYSVAWMIGGGAVFLLARYIAAGLAAILGKNIRRMSLVPIFQLTSGDSNRITRYIARSQKSAIVLIATGLLYGLSQGLGVYLASKILTHLF